VKKSWLFLSWLVGQLEFEIRVYFSAVSKKVACTKNLAHHLLIAVRTFQLQQDLAM